MKRAWKVTSWIAAIMGVVMISPFLFFVGMMFSSQMKEGTREHARHELAGKLNHLDPSIHVLGAFEASSYGGWHGDGSNTSIYLINPSDTDRFIERLKRFHEKQRIQWPDAYEFTWTEASRPELGGLEHLIPARYLPKGDDYLIARPVRGTVTISIGKTSGYICFTNIIT